MSLHLQSPTSTRGVKTRRTRTRQFAPPILRIRRTVSRDVYKRQDQRRQRNGGAGCKQAPESVRPDEKDAQAVFRQRREAARHDEDAILVKFSIPRKAGNIIKFYLENYLEVYYVSKNQIKKNGF